MIELRELHKLYDKCDPNFIIVKTSYGDFGRCQCGRIFAEEHIVQGFAGPTSGMVKLDHRTKKYLQRVKVWKHIIGLLEHELRKIKSDKQHGTASDVEPVQE